MSSRNRSVLLLVLVALASGVTGAGAGAAMGFGFGSTRAERKTYNLAVQDARQMLTQVKRASLVVHGVQERLTKMDDGLVPIDKAGVDAVTSTPQPVSADLFQRRRYLAYRPETVDRLFEYYVRVVYLWLQIERLAKATEHAGTAADASASRGVQALRTDVDRLVGTETALIHDLEQVAALPESTTPF